MEPWTATHFPCREGRRWHKQQILVHVDETLDRADPPRKPNRAEVDAYVYRSVIRGIVAIFVLVITVGLAGLYYERELLGVTEAVYRSIGLGGLLGILFLSDSVTTPIPPDALLVVLAKSSLSEHWFAVVTLMGFVSAFAGNVAHWLGQRVGEHPNLQRALAPLRRRTSHLVARHGKTAIALGALTPIPFSITCLSAGILGMPRREVAPMTLLRIPRFFLYYALIAQADTVMRWFL